MSGFTLIKCTENAGPDEQGYTLHYNDGPSVVKFRTESGLEVSLVPHTTKPWLRIGDGGADCLYGRWINFPELDRSTLKKTGTIIAVTTEDGVTMPTLDLIDPPETARATLSLSDGNVTCAVPVADFGTFMGSLVEALIAGDQNPIASAFEAVAPEEAERKIRSAQNLHLNCTNLRLYEMGCEALVPIKAGLDNFNKDVIHEATRVFKPSHSKFAPRHVFEPP